MLADLIGFHGCGACRSPRELRETVNDLAAVSELTSSDELRDHFHAPFSARMAVTALWERRRELEDCASDEPA